MERTVKLRWAFLGKGRSKPRAGAILFNDGWRVLQMGVEVVEDAEQGIWTVRRVWRDVDEVVEPKAEKRK